MAADELVAIKRIVLMQAGVLVFVAAVALSAGGWLDARSAFLGGLAGFLPNLYFAFRIARAMGKSAKRVLRAFYFGEAAKLIGTALLFFLILQLQGIRFFPLFAGFLSVLVVFWFALLVGNRQI